MTFAPSPITVFWRPGCPYCTRLRSGLVRAHIPVLEVDIWQDPEAAAKVRAITGGSETVPTVTIGDAALVNPSVRRVLEEIAAQAPELVSDENAPFAKTAVRRERLRPVKWTVIALLVVASLVTRSHGIPAATWALAGTAAAVLVVFEAMARRPRSGRSHPAGG